MLMESPVYWVQEIEDEDMKLFLVMVYLVRKLEEPNFLEVSYPGNKW